MISLGYEALQRLLRALETASFWDGMKVHLISAPFTADPTLQIADLTEADYDGYAAVTLATPAATEYLGPLGDVTAVFPTAIFQPTGSTTPNQIYGYWIDSAWGGTGDRPLTIVQFEEPVAMTSPLNALLVDAVVPLGQPRIQTA